MYDYWSKAPPSPERPGEKWAYLISVGFSRPVCSLCHGFLSKWPSWIVFAANCLGKAWWSESLMWLSSLTAQNGVSFQRGLCTSMCLHACVSWVNIMRPGCAAFDVLSRTVMWEQRAVCVMLVCMDVPGLCDSAPVWSVWAYLYFLIRVCSVSAVKCQTDRLIPNPRRGPPLPLEVSLTFPFRSTTSHPFVFLWRNCWTK